MSEIESAPFIRLLWKNHKKCFLLEAVFPCDKPSFEIITNIENLRQYKGRTSLENLRAYLQISNELHISV